MAGPRLGRMNGRHDRDMPCKVAIARCSTELTEELTIFADDVRFGKDPNAESDMVRWAITVDLRNALLDWRSPGANLTPGPS